MMMTKIWALMCVALLVALPSTVHAARLISDGPSLSIPDLGQPEPSTVFEEVF